MLMPSALPQSMSGSTSNNETKVAKEIIWVLETHGETRHGSSIQLSNNQRIVYLSPPGIWSYNTTRQEVLEFLYDMEVKSAQDVVNEVLSHLPILNIVDTRLHKKEMKDGAFYLVMSEKKVYYMNRYSAFSISFSKKKSVDCNKIIISEAKSTATSTPTLKNLSELIDKLLKESESKWGTKKLTAAERLTEILKQDQPSRKNIITALQNNIKEVRGLYVREYGEKSQDYMLYVYLQDGNVSPSERTPLSPYIKGGVTADSFPLEAYIDSSENRVEAYLQCIMLRPDLGVVRLYVDDKLLSEEIEQGAAPKLIGMPLSAIISKITSNWSGVSHTFVWGACRGIAWYFSNTLATLASVRQYGASRRAYGETWTALLGRDPANRYNCDLHLLYSKSHGAPNEDSKYDGAIFNQLLKDGQVPIVESADSKFYCYVYNTDGNPQWLGPLQLTYNVFYSLSSLPLGKREISLQMMNDQKLNLMTDFLGKNGYSLGNNKIFLTASNEHTRSFVTALMQDMVAIKDGIMLEKTSDNKVYYYVSTGGSWSVEQLESTSADLFELFPEMDAIIGLYSAKDNTFKEIYDYIEAQKATTDPKFLPLDIFDQELRRAREEGKVTAKQIFQYAIPIEGALTREEVKVLSAINKAKHQLQAQQLAISGQETAKIIEELTNNTLTDSWSDDEDSKKHIAPKQQSQEEANSCKVFHREGSALPEELERYRNSFLILKKIAKLEWDIYYISEELTAQKLVKGVDRSNVIKLFKGKFPGVIGDSRILSRQEEKQILNDIDLLRDPISDNTPIKIP